MAMRTTPPLPRNLRSGTRRLNSEKVDKGPEITSKKIVSFAFMAAVLLYFLYWQTVGQTFDARASQAVGAEDVRTQLHANIFAGREMLRKKEENLNEMSKRCSDRDECSKQLLETLRKQRKEQAEKVEALDRRELEYLIQRAKEVEWRIETRAAFIETDGLRSSGSRQILSSNQKTDRTAPSHSRILL